MGACWMGACWMGVCRARRMVCESCRVVVHLVGVCLAEARKGPRPLAQGLALYQVGLVHEHVLPVQPENPLFHQSLV
ncbi:hypothetical protein EDD22DRAFT_936662 [Suillus occidentalis]|nr:hypothetical protein EDD22DRAFT_936662 [Suillus occidentalis]